MTPENQSFRQEILALQPALMECALRMARDENEAHHLVHMTMLEAFSLGEARGDDDAGAQVWLFGLLRGAFHSIARRRSARQERGHYANQRHLENAAQPEVPA